MVKPTSETRKPEIIQAAIKAIVKNGLPMPSYDQIADEAGMSRQLIRHYFPDHELLMVAVCDALSAAYRTHLREETQTSAAQRLPMVLDFYFNCLGEEGLAADDAVYNAVMSLATRSKPLRETLRAQFQSFQDMIAQDIQANHPMLTTEACRDIGYLFLSLLHGHRKMVVTVGLSQSYNSVTREALDRLIESYERNPEYTNRGAL